MITVHVGLHKTGSSSIQLALEHSSHRSWVCVPRPGHAINEAGIAEQLSRLPSNGVMSDENLLGSPFDGYQAIERRLEAIRAAVSGRPFRIVAFVRPQLDWLQSLYIQAIQQGKTDLPGDFVSQVTASPWIDWLRMLELLEDASGASEICIRPYVPSVDIVPEFFSIAQVPLGGYSPERMGRQNPSMTPRRAMLMRALNAGGWLASDETRHLRAFLQGLGKDSDRRAESVFPADVQDLIRSRYEGAWARLSVSQRLSPQSRQAFAQVAVDVDWSPSPWVGADLTSPPLAEEGLRLIAQQNRQQILSNRTATGLPAPLRRSIARLKRVARRLRP